MSTTGPTTGTSANAARRQRGAVQPLASTAPEFTTHEAGHRAHDDRVPEVPVEDTSAWRTGFFVCAAAATIGALPSPDSFEKRPRAMP